MKKPLIESDILGIPLVLILFILINAVIVLTPIILLQRQMVNQIKIGNAEVINTVRSSMVILTVSPTVAPTATPAAIRAIGPSAKNVIVPVTRPALK